MIDRDKIAHRTIDTNRLEDAAVSTAKIADSAISTAKIADAAVSTAKIADAAVTNAKIAANAVTAGKMFAKTVAVTVAAGATSGSSAADADLEGGAIVGYYPTGNQDQLVDSIVLNADGSVTITLAAAATADNTFNVVVLAA